MYKPDDEFYIGKDSKFEFELLDFDNKSLINVAEKLTGKLHENTKMSKFNTTRCILNHLVKFTNYTWNRGRTFEDLNALMICFIQGLFIKSSDHFGPLDPESSVIYNQLLACNKLNLITYNSQPYDEFVPEHTGLNTRQYAFIDALCYKEDSDKLLKSITRESNTIKAYCINLRTETTTVYGAKINLYGSSQFINSKWVDSNLLMSGLEPSYDLYIDMIKSDFNNFSKDLIDKTKED